MKSFKRIEDRAQVRIDLVAHVARQEAEPLARLDRGARQDQPLDGALLEQRDRVADREPGLAGAGRTLGEDELVLLEGAQIGVLRGVRARTGPRLRVAICSNGAFSGAPSAAGETATP